RHTLASETDPRRSLGSGSYTATPTRWPTTRPTAQASTPSPASSRLAVSGFSLVSHVLAAPMTSSVATASDAAIASVGCGAGWKKYGTSVSSAPARYEKPVTAAICTGGSNVSSASPG